MSNRVTGPPQDRRSEELTASDAQRIAQSLRDEAAHWERVAASLAAEIPDVNEAGA